MLKVLRGSTPPITMPLNRSLFSKGGLYDEKPGVVDTTFKDDDPTVYFDLKQGDEALGRVEMRLYSHIVVAVVRCEL